MDQSKTFNFTGLVSVGSHHGGDCFVVEHLVRLENRIVGLTPSSDVVLARAAHAVLAGEEGVVLRVVYMVVHLWTLVVFLKLVQRKRWYLSSTLRPVTLI